MKKLHLIQAYFKYLLRAKGAHGTHSPFIFAFINEVLKDQREFYAFEEIKALRKELNNNHAFVEQKDFGAGSLHNDTNKRKISEIAKHAGRTEKYGKLLFRLSNYFELNHILELGTSLGLGTSYLGKARENAELVTIEGCPNIAQLAKENFAKIGLKNIHQHTGNFDVILEDVLKQYDTFDLIFIDGNHRKDPTLQYFELCKKNIHPNSLIVFDDIHWSKDMSEAWEQIKRDPQVKVSIDLFQFGLVFFMQEVKEKQDFVLRY